MIVDPSGYVDARSAADPRTTARVLFREDFRAHPLGMWNDGVGDAYRDCDIMFNGRPSVRLDTQGQVNGGATNPGRTAATSGVVFKRRIHDSFSGLFAIECWFRFTSTNNNGTTTPFFSLSVYNRTGTDTAADGSVDTSLAWHSRLWLFQNGNNLDLTGLVLDGAATNTANGGGTTGRGGTVAVYTKVTTSYLQNGAGSHNWDPSASSGRLDRAGGWHYAYLASNMATKKYVACRIDSQPFIDLSGYDLDCTTSSGFAGMHFSAEYSANTSTRRFMNIAALTGYGA